MSGVREEKVNVRDFGFCSVAALKTWCLKSRSHAAYDVWVLFKFRKLSLKCALDLSEEVGFDL